MHFASFLIDYNGPLNMIFLQSFDLSIKVKFLWL